MYLRPIAYENIYFVIGVKASLEELAQEKPLEDIIKELPEERRSYDEMIYYGEEEDFDDYLFDISGADGYVKFNAIFTGMATVWFEEDETYSFTPEIHYLVAFPEEVNSFLNYDNFAEIKEEKGE